MEEKVYDEFVTTIFDNLKERGRNIPIELVEMIVDVVDELEAVLDSYETPAE